jgi:hypothetical protein
MSQSPVAMCGNGKPTAGIAHPPFKTHGDLVIQGDGARSPVAARLLVPSKDRCPEETERTGLRGGRDMTQHLRALAAIGTLFGALFGAEPACAQKHGGILKLYTLDSPASMSILEETTVFAQRPMMGVFNNLVVFDQHVKQNSLQSIVPDLATGWSWNEDGTELTFSLCHGVKWHDGKPFTAKDVQCTWDLLTGKSSDKLRLNPRKDWYRNLEEVRADGDYEVTFRLKRPQPSLLVLLGWGVSPVYPCHVPARDMCSHPIGTGPFKSSSSHQTSRSRSRETPITGKTASLISTASNIRSSGICRPRYWHSSPANWT